MPALDSRILIAVPFALAEAFLLWTLWNFIKQGFKKRSRVPSRLVSISEMAAPAYPRVVNFPEPARAAQSSRSSERDLGPRPQPSGQGSLASNRLAGVATR